VGLDETMWPLDAEQVAAVLAAAEYAVDAAELDRLATMGQIPRLAQFDGRDVLAIVGALEGRQQWKLTPSRHDVKKNQAFLNLENNVKLGPDGFRAMLEQLKQFDFTLTLRLLIEAESRELRERCGAILAALRIGEAMGLMTPQATLNPEDRSDE
jgi:hypothetical protein